MYHQPALAGSDSPPNLSFQHPPSPLTRLRDCIPVIFSSAPASAPAPSGPRLLQLCASGACQGPPRLSSPPDRLCHQRPISMTARPCRTLLSSRLRLPRPPPPRRASPIPRSPPSPSIRAAPSVPARPIRMASALHQPGASSRGSMPAVSCDKGMIADICSAGEDMHRQAVNGR